MKNAQISLFLILALLPLGTKAQENIIKTSVSGPFWGDYNLSYERATGIKNSIILKIGYWNPVASPFFDEKVLTPGEYSFQDAHGTLEASVEYRFYMNKSNSIKGFYLGPYMRNFNLAAQYTDEIDGDLFDVDATVNTFGIGAQIGYQWLINDIVAIDLYFFGAGVDFYNLKLVYSTPQSGFNYNTIVDDITEVFEDVNYFKKRLKNKVNTDNETTRLPFLFPGFRIGLNVGIAF